MTDKPIVSNNSSNSQPLLLAAWSQTTTLAEKVAYWNSKSYTDSPRKGERRRVYRRKAA